MGTPLVIDLFSKEATIKLVYEDIKAKDKSL